MKAHQHHKLRTADENMNLPYLFHGLLVGGEGVEFSKNELRAVFASTLSPFWKLNIWSCMIDLTEELYLWQLMVY